DVGSKATLSVLLRSPDREQFQAIGLINFEGAADVVAITIGPCALGESVTSLGDKTNRQSEFVFQKAGAQDRGAFQEAITANLSLKGATTTVVRGIGDVVHGATDGRSRERRYTQTTLHLNGAGDIAEAVPIRPIEPAVLQIVGGDTIDQN